MVKADLSRDYYSDLGISSDADTAEIKKQFKKLALTYHPDRNPGRESEVTAKFQKIQSAHEVLIDPAERAKYDSNRTGRYASSFRNSYTTGTSSGMRGNPWSNVSSQFPTPPKHPTARKPAPPPSTGARRYEKFATPNQSAYQAQQEGAEGRRAAWENLRHAGRTDHGPGKTWNAPQPPPRGTPRSGRDESNAQSHPPPPKTQPGHEEFRTAYSRSQSTNASTRKGFMPNTPGGDEPPAPMGAYFTQRNKSGTPPVPPPREPPAPKASEQREYTTKDPPADPLRGYRDKPAPAMDGRQSQPYSTHGGEKFNLFESAAMGRSKSTRVPESKNSVPRPGSDSNLNSPQRAKSFAERPQRRPPPAHAESADLDTSSSDDYDMPQMKPNASRFGKSTRQSNGTTPKESPRSGATNGERGKAAPRNGPSPMNSSQAKPTSNGEPSMYADPFPVKSDPKKSPFTVLQDAKKDSGFSVRRATVSDSISPKVRISPANSQPYGFTPNKYLNSTRAGLAATVTPPSGITVPRDLNRFEDCQRSILDNLLYKRVVSSGDTPKVSTVCKSGLKQPAKPEEQSPSKKRKPSSYLQPLHSFACAPAEFKKPMGHIKNNANPRPPISFTFPVNDDTFTRTQPRSSFSNSAENISTKFTPEDWDGKFEAGGDYFKPDVKPGAVPPRARAQSTSRTRGRSPIKTRPVPDPPIFMQPRVDPETPLESPGGTKFDAGRWGDFGTEAFMPPTKPGAPPRTMPGRKRTNPTVRMTMGGHAAVVDDSSTSDEKPLFNGPSKTPQTKRQTPTPPIVPEPMDLDSEPAPTQVPSKSSMAGNMRGKGLNINTEAPKRPATSASASPVDTAALNVDLEDLNVDLISGLNMPEPPKPPVLPFIPAGQERPTRAAYVEYVERHKTYMQAWDLCNGRFLLHMVTRKQINADSGEKRWTDSSITNDYRKGLREDVIVLNRWREITDCHEKIVKEFVIMRERMKTKEDPRTDRPSPRKKTH